MVEKNTDVVLRPRSRRQRSELHKCQDCSSVLTDANWTASMQKYRRYVCGKCWTKRQRGYQNVDPSRRIRKIERNREYRAGWSDERKAIEARRQYSSWLKRRYGITIEEYEQMMTAQSGQCAICLTTEPSGKGRFHVDHCHTSGKVRGLLCTSCNMMLGMVNECSNILTSAIKYLADHKIENRKATGGKAY